MINTHPICQQKIHYYTTDFPTQNHANDHHYIIFQMFQDNHTTNIAIASGNHT